MVPTFQVSPLAVITTEVIAAVERHVLIVLPTEPEPFVSPDQVVRAGLKVEPAYEKMSLVIINGTEVLGFPKLILMFELFEVVSVDTDAPVPCKRV